MTYRSRRPFIWQDEMTEVREAFRRVAKVRRSGYSGFSMWVSESPTAGTLSQNRLRRRQAQFGMKLRHLNYNEHPFEAFTHLHNIRSMCNRIKNQETVTERKKKAVDLESRPALLRRPVTANCATLQDRGCQKTVNKLLRPQSAPLRTPGHVPLHYMSPVPTLLYGFAHNRTRSKVPNSRSKNGTAMTSTLSTFSSHDKQTPISGKFPSKTPEQGNGTPRQSSRRLVTDGLFDHVKPTCPVTNTMESSHHSSLDSMSILKVGLMSTAVKVVNVRPQCRMKVQSEDQDWLINQFSLENVKQREDLSAVKEQDRDILILPAIRAEIISMSTNDLEFFDVKARSSSSEKTRSCFSNSTVEGEGLQLHYPLSASHVPGERAAVKSSDTCPVQTRNPHVKSAKGLFFSPKHFGTSVLSNYLRPSSSQVGSRCRVFASRDGIGHQNKVQSKRD